LVFANTKISRKYWNNWLKKDLLINFEHALSPAEEADTYDLKPKQEDGQPDVEFLSALLDRVKKVMALKMVKRPYNFLLEDTFDDTDLETMQERVKHMGIIAHAQGFFYHIKGMTQRVEDPKSSKKFYEEAISKFEEALDQDPNNKEVNHKKKKKKQKKVLFNLFFLQILLSIALSWILHIEEDYKQVPNAKFHVDDPRVTKAEEYSLRAISVEPKYDPFSLFRYAQFLERCNRLQEAEDYYLQSLEADPNNPACLHCYGNLLTARGLHEIAEKFYLRSSKNTIGKTHWPEYYL